MHNLKSHLNINKALLCDGEFLHIRCCAYIVNLIVQDGLKEVDEVVHKVHESVKYDRALQTTKQKFLQCVNRVGLELKKGLRQDVPTRWNSTYFMLTTALLYKDVFARLSVREKQYKIEILGEDWRLAAILQDNLKLFYQVTEMFSGTKYPTTNVFFLHVCDIRLSLSEWLKSENEVIKEMTVKMIENFENLKRIENLDLFIYF